MQYQSTANNAAVPSFPIFAPKLVFPVRALEFLKKNFDDICRRSVTVCSDVISLKKPTNDFSLNVKKKTIAIS